VNVGQLLGDEARECRAQRYADDRQRDGQRAVAAWHVFRSKRARIRQGATESEARQKPQHRQGLDTGRIGRGGRTRTENEKARDEGATPAEAVSWGKVNPSVLPDTVVAYCDSTIAFPLFCEYAIGSDNGRRQRKELVHKRAALVADLKRQASAARAKTMSEQRA